MKNITVILAISAFALSACAEGGFPADKSVDRGFLDSKDLASLQWGIWVDPDGCDVWASDDGLEGYWARRIDKYGKPVCSGVAPPTHTTLNFKSGSKIRDPN